MDKDKEAPRLKIKREVLKKAAVEETMAFSIVLEAVLERPFWWLPEKFVLCALEDLPRAIQTFFKEMYLIHNGWGLYYFKHAGCVMLEVDNPRLNAVLASAEGEERVGAEGEEVKDLGACGSVTFFHIALQALGMCTASLRATPVSSDVLRKEEWSCTWHPNSGTTGTRGREGHWLPTRATLNVPNKVQSRKWTSTCLADWTTFATFGGVARGHNLSSDVQGGEEHLFTQSLVGEPHKQPNTPVDPDGRVAKNGPDLQAKHCLGMSPPRVI